jgi:AcrR family transcriptional regulator
VSDDSVARVERACEALARDDYPVTFTEVAARAGMSRTTLYRRPELRAVVEEHRAQGREAYTLTGLAIQIENLRRSLEAVAAKVRWHEEALRQLKPKPIRRK